MEITELRSIALQQRLRDVALVELVQGAQRVRIVMPTSAAAAAAPTVQPVATSVASPGARLVKAEALGLLRLTHPDAAGRPVEPGDAVQQGQCLALLQVGELLSPVAAPCAGTVLKVLAAEGDRIDYGTPLFELAAAQG